MTRTTAAAAAEPGAVIDAVRLLPTRDFERTELANASIVSQGGCHKLVFREVLLREAVR